MCFIVHKTTLELERVILTTLYFASVENIDSNALLKEYFIIMHFNTLMHR
jgi:hypothetical protein